MSVHIEQHPSRVSERPVVLAAFQHGRHFTRATAKRYLDVVQHASFVGALGVGLGVQPVAGGRWPVASLGPHYAAALIAKDLGDDGPESGRRFDYVITHDRANLTAAASSLLQLVSPADSFTG
jgi:DICT domain-containing protein